MTAARKGNTDQVINWMEGSMDLLTEDVRDTMNQTVFSGGEVWGYATFNADTECGPCGTPTSAFFGDIQKLFDRGRRGRHTVQPHRRQHGVAVIDTGVRHHATPALSSRAPATLHLRSAASLRPSRTWFWLSRSPPTWCRTPLFPVQPLCRRARRHLRQPWLQTNMFGVPPSRRRHATLASNGFKPARWPSPCPSDPGRHPDGH